MDRNLLLASAAFALLGTVAITLLFSSTTQSAGVAEVPVESTDIAVPPPRRPPPAARDATPERPTGPFRDDQQDVVGDKTAQSTVPGETRYGPSHQELREQLMDPDEIDRRERAREAHFERITETTRRRFVDFALSRGVDRQETLDAAAKLEDHMHADRAVREAVRTGDLTRDEAKAEIAELRQNIEDELMTVLGEEDYAELRKAVPGKW